MKTVGYRSTFKLLVFASFILLIALLSIIHLERVPPLGWDEGWTLSVARNWAEKGVYGRLLSGNPTSPGLAASFTVTTPIAVVFRWLGVGIWQGRIVGLIFLIGSVTLLYVLAVQIYDRTVARLALVALFMMSMFAEWHPIIMGRQVLGEVPMLFFILGGYFCFYLALSRSLWFMPLTVLLWATALVTKAQVPPFFATSLIVPLVLTLWSRQWRIAIVIGSALASTFLAVKGLLWLQNMMFDERNTALPEIYSTVAFVPILQIRWRALQASLFLLPTILGVLYESRNSRQLTHSSRLKSDIDILRVTVLVFTGSWLSWYIFASNPAYRYAFVPSFVGSIFTAKLLRDLVDREVKVFSWKKTGTSEAMNAMQRTASPELSLALLLIAVWSFSTFRMLYQVYVVEGDESATQVAEFLNTQASPGSLIETYDSQIHFLLDRRYHFPPDQVHLDLIRRTFPGNHTKVRIDYDPLASEPDYLVVGDFIKDLGLYDPVVRTGAFQLIREFKQYRVYKKAR